MTSKQITRFVMLEFLRVTAVFAVAITIAVSIGLSLKNTSAPADRVADADNVELSPLVNINELPEEFMETYLNDYTKLASGDNKENILIVASATPLADTFGAKTVVSAANNQYFLEYASSEEKDYAFEQISDLSDVDVYKNEECLLDDFESDGAGSAGGSDYNSWGIEKMGLDHASELVENYSGKSDIVVAVIDSGLDVKAFNEQFSGKLAGEYNILNPELGLTDEAGHGSHVAGTIAEGTPSNVKIFPVKISTYGSMYTTDIIAGVDYVNYYTDADVVNMSLGGPSADRAEHLSLSALSANNTTIVAAAGNDGMDMPSYPAAFDMTISVAAVDSSLNLATFSNYGSTIDFAAPGVDVFSIGGKMSGTSMASPHVAAAAAIAKSFNKSLTLEQVKDFLKTRTIDLGAEGWDHQFGYGFIDFNGASLCVSGDLSCDEFSILRAKRESGIEVVDPVLTPYNYGSVTNVLATKMKVYNSDGTYTINPLGDFGTDVEISGYNPYASGEQTVTVSYGGFTDSFRVTNPGSWDSGWEYYTEVDLTAEHEEFTYLGTYFDHGLDIKTLYFPERVDGHTIDGVGGRGCLFGGSQCGRPDSEDAKIYETFVLPESITAIGYMGLAGDRDGNEYFSDLRLENLHKIVSLAPKIKVYDSGLSSLYGLVRIEGRVAFVESYFADGDSSMRTLDGWGAFQQDKYLEEVTLADGTKFIPTVAFGSCASLKTIDLPATVESIGGDAFSNTGLRRIDLSGVTQIEDGAFEGANLEEVYIPATLTDIRGNVFSSNAYLSRIVVADGNPVYDSRDDSNAVIETSTNKMIIGTNNTVIPQSVRSIGQNVFSGLSQLNELVVPEGVESIGAFAFNRVVSQKVVLPRSLNNFDEVAVIGGAYVVFWVHDDTYAKDRVAELGLPYVLIGHTEDNYIRIYDYGTVLLDENYTFTATEKITPDKLVIVVYYYDATTGEAFEYPEVIEDYEVIYNEGRSESLLGGYNYVVLKFDTGFGYKGLTVEGAFMAAKLTPEFEIPTGLSAYAGEPLANVALPEGFSWIDDGEFVEESKTEYLARFSAGDSNYNDVYGIPIPIEVIVGTTFVEIFPDANLRSCILNELNDGGAEITEDNINLDDVYGLTSLTCVPENESEKIVNARGIEKLTALESLDLSGNAIEKINLKNNTALESLDLLGNSLEKIDLSNNTALDYLAVNEVFINTSAYAEYIYDGEDAQLVMDISGLGFLKPGAFSVGDATYNPETGYIFFGDEATEYITRGGIYSGAVIAQYTSSGEIVQYTIGGHPRNVYVNLYADGASLGLLDLGGARNKSFFTGERMKKRDFISLVAQVSNLSADYVLENMVRLAGVDDEYIVVGQDDLEFTLYFENLRTKKAMPVDPDTPDTPTDDDDDDDPAVPNTGRGFLANFGIYQPLAATVPIMMFFVIRLARKSRKQKTSREHGVR
ncbi:S8 family serine peptidase [Candidatus Saccharibacteria bacterium]|nr:S8 family serine peptidase [Candidatus Saccharibacteria bacterium]